MKIAFVIPSFYPAVIYGGTIDSSLYTAQELARLNYEIYVSTTNTNMHSRLDVVTGKYNMMEKNLFVKYYNETMIGKFSLPLFLHLPGDIKKSDAVQIHAIFNTPIPWALFLSWIYKKQVLLTPHGVLGTWIMTHGNQFKKLWLRLFIKPFANRILWRATSLMEKNEIQNHFPKARIIIIPNGINIQEHESFNYFSRETYLRKFGKKDMRASHLIISMGRIQEKKGFDILIKAFHIISKELPESHLFIAGEDEGEKARLIQLISNLNLTDRVHFPGLLQAQNRVDFLANADVFALPSHNENFGNVYAESLASGTPIVASLNTPWEEVEQEGCGKWVENTPDATASAIRELLTKDRDKMRLQAKKYAEKFSWTKIGKQFSRMYEVLDKKDLANSN